MEYKSKEQKPQREITEKDTKRRIKQLETAKENGQRIEGFVKKVDEEFNLHVSLGAGVMAFVPRAEVSSIIEENGLPAENASTSKLNKVIQFKITDIFYTENELQPKIMLSSKQVELEVRKWMYMHLKPGMKLKGTVRGLTEYFAFVDVGGGVTAVIRVDDISKVRIKHANERFKYGQRIEAIVKTYDRDTGRIELSYKELLGSFKDNVKDLKEGQLVEGIVRSREKNGIYVELSPNLIGLAAHRSGLEYGQKVLVHIKKINFEKEKIKLVIVG